MSQTFIEKQLEKVMIADLSNFDLQTNTYKIPKYTKPHYEVGKCYLIQLPKNIINNTTCILATNWNNHIMPDHEYYKAYVNKTIGTYAYFDCLAYDFDTKQDLTTM